MRRIVGAVLDWEGTGEAAFSVTFLGAGRMRALNRRTFGRDRVTDVIAFELPHAGRQGGDLYLCPSAARTAAVTQGVPLAHELVRVLVHGTLHALGYHHPEGAGRTRSPMWRRQERYVRALLARGR
ncbi:MAG: rRNA maturation RNase YbeY [Gemmatimonadetes bacterium]|nr:rRNA maturation RNase YbeY [Gemmatimonadota bacterium]